MKNNLITYTTYKLVGLLASSIFMPFLFVVLQGTHLIALSDYVLVGYIISMGILSCILSWAIGKGMESTQYED